MPEQSRSDAQVSGIADPTRDIRLPPLPGRPVVLPSEWRGNVAADHAAPQPDAERTVAVPAPGQPAAEAPDAATAESTTGTSIADEPTDNLQTPRHKTLTFGAPGENVAAAVPPNLPLPRVVPAPPRTRRWPWAVLIALPLIVIAVAAVLLIVLLRGA